MTGFRPRIRRYDRAVDAYGQEPETRFLSRIVPRLEEPSAIDVGAERGAFVAALLEGGATSVHAFEPEPRNVDALRARFQSDARVALHDIAVSDADHELTLRLSKDLAGVPLSFGHTVLDRPDTDQIAWDRSIRVEARSLGSLVETGELPSRVGIVKVDTEGHDLAVVVGMGALECDVLMVEHWVDLPHSLGPCPWTLDEMAAAAEEHGFSHFAFLHHRDELTILEWDEAHAPSGSMGNLVFLNDRVADSLYPVALEISSSLALDVLAAAEARAAVNAERLAVIEDLTRERDIQAEAAAVRLAALEELAEQAKAAES